MSSFPKLDLREVGSFLGEPKGGCVCSLVESEGGWVCPLGVSRKAVYFLECARSLVHC
jgi:hypothetical protein